MTRQTTDVANFDPARQKTETALPYFKLDPAVMAQAEAPVMVMDRRGEPLFANKNARSFAQGIRDGLFPEINALVGRALTTPGGVVELMTFEVQNGTATLELTALPLADDTVLLLPRDVSMDRNLRDALIDSRQRYRDIVEVSSAFAWETDDNGQFVFVSPRGALGYRPEEMLGHRAIDFMLDPTDTDAEDVFRSRRAARDVPIWFRTSDNGQACLSVSATPVYNRDGERTGTRGLAHDITEQRKRESEVTTARNRDRLMTYIVRTMRDEIDPTAVLQSAADATARALACSGCIIFRCEGTEEDLSVSGDAQSMYITASHGDKNLNELAKTAVGLLKKGSDLFEGEIEDYRAVVRRCRYHQRVNGAVVVMFSVDHPIPNDGERAIISEVADQVGIAIEQAINHDRIVTLSRTDGMTGLLNRRAFFEELSRRYDRLMHESRPAALMYVDMDNFKMVNDVHGHQSGDEAILTLSRLLTANTRPGDLVARLGGDEFVVWLDGADKQAAAQRARRLIEESAILTPLSGSMDHPLGISVGIAVHEPDDEEELDALVQRADSTMYEIKKHGKGSFGIASVAGSNAPAEIEERGK